VRLKQHFDEKNFIQNLLTN